MAISLNDLRTTRADKPPRMLLYGPEKIGKTTLGSEFPSPVFLKLEDGDTAGLELTGWSRHAEEDAQKIQNYNDVLDTISALYGEHDFKTLVVDSLSSLEPMIWAEICERNRWASIESPGFGKGYVEADMLWQEFMRALSGLRRVKNMAIVLIAHDEIKRVEDPIHGPLDKYSIQLHKRAADIVKKEVDIIAFVNYRVSITETKGKFNSTHRKGVGAGERVIYFAARPGFIAGNRYDMPDELPYRRGDGFSGMAPFLQSNRRKDADAVVDDEKEAA